MNISPAVQDFLARQRNVIMSTIRADGSPQISPLWYLFDGDEFIISTAKETAKWSNLRRDPRVALCVDDPVTGQMVVAYGTARLEDEGIREATRAVVEKYVKDPAQVEAHMERIFRDWTRVILRIRPDKLISRNLDGPKTYEVEHTQ
jgi:PPOX class probable F420-dependent enzyme